MEMMVIGANVAGMGRGGKQTDPGTLCRVTRSARIGVLSPSAPEREREESRERKHVEHADRAYRKHLRRRIRRQRLRIEAAGDDFEGVVGKVVCGRFHVFLQNGLGLNEASSSHATTISAPANVAP